MTVAFYDDFERSDGSPGTGWVEDAGTWEITSGKLRVTSSGRIRVNRSPTGPNVCARVWMTEPSTKPRTIGIRLRQNVAGTDYVYFAFGLNATTISIQISTYVGGSGTTLATRTIPVTWTDPVDLMCSCAGDTAYAWVNAYLWMAVFQNAVSGLGDVVLAFSNSDVYANTFAFYDLSNDAGVVDIPETPDENGYYSLTLHNPGADWTAGTPGAPVFECTNGEIISQEVTDADTATVVWNPPLVTTAGDIYDPQNEWHYQITIGGVGTPSGGGGGGGGLTTEQAATIDDLADYLTDYNTQADGGASLFLQLGNIILLMKAQPSGGGDEAIQRTMNAILSETDGIAIIKNRVDLINDKVDTISDEQGYTLPSVQEAIRGTSSRDLTQVYNLIDALEVADPTDVTEILNAIAAIRTANLWTLDSVKTWIEAIETGSNQDVLDELARIRTANNWSLGTLYDLLVAIPTTTYGTQLTDIHDDIALIPTNPITSLAPVIEDVADLSTNVDGHAADILNAIDNIPTNPITSLQSVLDAISALDTLIDGYVSDILEAIEALAGLNATNVPPIWPGAANATLGTPVALDRSFSFSGACDGVIVNITGDPLSKGSYDWGSVTQHPHAAYIAFKHDSNAYEDCQGATFPSQCLCPKLAAHATGFIGRTRAGVTGTATPWTINSA